MLKTLYIRNYALFKDSRIDFQDGLNILTGETGAGKSLLIGALGLIMGKRADSSFVFLYDEKCIVEATFTKLAPIIMGQLKAFEDFDIEEDEEIILRREIRPNGKSRAFVCDTPVSLQVLREVSALLLDLHGQHDNQVLLSNDKQMDLLDSYAGSEDLLEQFKMQLKRANELASTLDELIEKDKNAKQQLEYLNYQVKELGEADLKADEEEELEQELNLLQNSEGVRETLNLATEKLYQQDVSIYSELSELMEALRKVSNVNNQLAATVNELGDVLEKIKDASFGFQDMLETIESDPQRLAFIEERLGMYHTFKLKYQVKSGEELVQLYEGIAEKLLEYESLEERIKELRDKLELENEKLIGLGLRLEEKRQLARPELERKVDDLLEQVGFQKARFNVEIERAYHPQGKLEINGEAVRTSSNGINKSRFLIQTNPGIPAGQLAQIASGGEISRVMLAIKAALAEKSSFPVMIFDEIDTGISGEIANKVGDVMRLLAKNFQILSITHLPQIAAKGHAHFQIRKRVEGEQTHSFVQQLEHDDRVNIIAQMISGDQPTASAIQNAEELIGQ
ncbi:MAG: DNA repair protein RecN [Bacteroidia bacterium]|nr:DNA repair protein RecN [Bacteroidia bacterium]